MSWSLEFDEPIVLSKGKPLRTLRDAGEHVAALPKKEAVKSHWRVAASCLLEASEKGGGLVVMAKIAMLRALKADESQPKQTAKKAAKKYHASGRWRRAPLGTRINVPLAARLAWGCPSFLF
jgi:hypothetical protein